MKALEYATTLATLAVSTTQTTATQAQSPLSDNIFLTHSPAAKLGETFYSQAGLNQPVLRHLNEINLESANEATHQDRCIAAIGQFSDLCTSEDLKTLPDGGSPQQPICIESMMTLGEACLGIDPADTVPQWEEEPSACTHALGEFVDSCDSEQIDQLLHGVLDKVFATECPDVRLLPTGTAPCVEGMLSVVNRCFLDAIREADVTVTIGDHSSTSSAFEIEDITLQTCAPTVAPSMGSMQPTAAQSASPSEATSRSVEPSSSPSIKETNEETDETTEEKSDGNTSGASQLSAYGLAAAVSTVAVGLQNL